MSKKLTVDERHRRILAIRWLPIFSYYKRRRLKVTATRYKKAGFPVPKRILDACYEEFDRQRHREFKQKFPSLDMGALNEWKAEWLKAKAKATAP